jgi:hypothetical protein
MNHPEPVAAEAAGNPATTPSAGPAASPKRQAVRVGRDLEETYHALRATVDLLYQASAGSVNPALRQARRSGDDALELAEYAKRMLDDGIERLRTRPDSGPPHTVDEVAESLTAVRNRLGATAQRMASLPRQVAAAKADLAAFGRDDSTTEDVSDRWTAADEQLHLATMSLMTAIDALKSFLKDLTGITVTDEWSAMFRPTPGPQRGGTRDA